MNENNNYFITCPHCGAKLKSNAILCMRCGYNLNTNTDIRTSKQIYKATEDKKRDKTSLLCLIVSLINLIGGLPFLIKYSAIWILLGRTTAKSIGSRFIIYLATGYTVASVVAVLAFIFSFITKGKTHRSAVVAIISSFIIGLVAAIALVKLYI
jgi:uncharacterized membrane protein YvbJ